MGLRAIDAVQQYSQYRHDGPDNFIPYRIMMAIAWYAGDDGVAGVAGEPKKCPTINTIAQRANVHRNTVMNWLPLLREAGELTTEKHGAGRGAHVVYTILLSVNGTTGLDIGTTDQSDDVPLTSHSDRELVQEIAQLRDLLVQQNALLVQQMKLMAQWNGTNGTTLQSNDVLDPLDPNIDPGDLTRARGGDELWQAACELVEKWKNKLAIYQRLDPDNETHKADYYAPILRLVVDFEGDSERAWQALEAEYTRMLGDGLTPRRAAPVVQQVIGNINRYGRAAYPTNGHGPQPGVEEGQMFEDEHGRYIYRNGKVQRMELEDARL